MTKEEKRILKVVKQLIKLDGWELDYKQGYTTLSRGPILLRFFMQGCYKKRVVLEVDGERIASKRYGPIPRFFHSTIDEHKRAKRRKSLAIATSALEQET